MTYANNGWTALAEPTRRSIFERLLERPASVTEIAADLPISRPAVSQHLKVLKDAGLVADTPAGKQRIYRVDTAGLAVFRAELDLFWSRALTAYKPIAEQSGEKA